MEETKPMETPVPPTAKPMSKKLIAIIAIVVAAIVVIASVSYVVMRQGGGGGIFGEKDSDGDGVGDNADAFPTNPNEQYDSDNDGVGNNADKFPYDSTQWADRDGDGYGDNPNGNNPDAFPDDSTEWKDSVSDGIGDNDDIYDAGNGGIKVCISSYQGDGSSDESGAPDPYFNITIWAYQAGQWKILGSKTSSIYTNTDSVSYPLTLTIDVDDDIPYVYIGIYAYDDDFWSSDDIIDLNGTSTSYYDACCYFYPRTNSYSTFSDDGRLDLADEMDGEIEWYCQVVKM